LWVIVVFLLGREYSSGGYAEYRKKKKKEYSDIFLTSR
jgi:hypothetical protein